MFVSKPNCYCGSIVHKHHFSESRLKLPEMFFVEMRRKISTHIRMFIMSDCTFTINVVLLCLLIFQQKNNPSIRSPR